ncbi:MAG TPA: ABC transporter substrate-binding protein [Geminicoccus sp.]|uniref:ABC transporter substrate-binding protein n=1 Tax=Geminicoccus sp. TaxID=2024832 RepID=UPI002B52EDFD|nr:ABC transporter substrate-binding protein [Geminicoccus sp.]HWL69685.1 ABC transporter substrate-binding protein [Geminicoccus sp.]
MTAAVVALATLTISFLNMAAATELSVAREFDADGLDPHRYGSTRSMQVTNLIFDTLLTMDLDGAIHPGLASTWQVSGDGKTYAFTIRDGVNCHDGTVLDATAVKASVDRAIDPATVNPNAPAWGPIKTATVSGDVVTISLSEPFAPFLSFLTSIPSAIVCPASVSGDQFWPVGTGPFKLVSWRRDDRIELAANPDYRNFNPLIENPGRPHIDRLTLRVIPDAVARMAALRSGEVDMAEPSLEEAGYLDTDPDIRLYAAERSGELVFTGYTWKIPPFDDPEIRMAIAMALNRDAYRDIAFAGLTNVIDCAVAAGLFAYDPKQCATWRPPYDPERARAILTKSGYGPENPLAIRLLGPRRDGWVGMYQIMQQDLAEVGITAEIDAREPTAFLEMLASSNTASDGQPALWTFGISGVDPNYLYFVWKRPGFVNMGIDGELDALLEQQRHLSGDARAAKIHEVERYLLENSFMIPLLSPGWSWLMAHGSHVEGFKMGFMASQYFNDVRVTN